MASNHFTVNYIYREFHLTEQDTQHAAPKKLPDKIFNIHNPDNVLGLILALYVSFAISARKTAYMLREIFKINVSYQTVLNYAQAAAYYCHQVNLNSKGPVETFSVGDETYITIKGKNWYVFFFVSPENKAISAYHLADNRGIIPAITAIKEAIRKAHPNQEISIITDGNPSYVAATLYLNQNKLPKNKINHVRVIGLKNLDLDSEQFRPFKQIIERFNRTYKYHVRPAAGFNSFNGAMALTTLFVSHYNFLRPHSALKFNTPIKIPQLDPLHTIQAKWLQLIKLAM